MVTFILLTHWMMAIVLFTTPSDQKRTLSVVNEQFYYLKLVGITAKQTSLTCVNNDI